MSPIVAATTAGKGGRVGVGGDSAIAACEKAKEEYHRCLGSSGRRSWKCQEEEQRLRLCSATLEQSYCIDETKALIDCGRSPDKTGCAKQFVAMRECNRYGGPKVVERSGKYVNPIPSFSSSQRGDGGRAVEVCSASVPQRSDASISTELERLRKALAVKGVAADGHGSVYKWESLRSRPGH